MMRFVAFSMMVVLVGSTQSTAFANTEGCEQEKCIGVVDAGSTGSRLHIYSYDLDSNNTPINITERSSKKIKPGLASIEATESSIGNYFNTLFSSSVPHQWPVYVYATAGMRLLPSPKQQQVHTLVKNWFEKQGSWQLMSSRTITGSDEGLFGWLAVNYQLGNLSKNTNTVNTSEKKGIGVIDIGGASVQISFPVTNTQGINEKDIRTVMINGEPQQLFVKSFLGLGQNEVTHQFLDSKVCFVNGYEMSTGETAQGDANSCADKVSPLINEVHQVSAAVRHGQYFNPVGRWYVLGGIDAMVKNPVFDFKNNVFNSEELLYKAQVDVCQQPWSALSSKYPNDEYLYSYCLMSAYFYSLMVDGYGILPEKNLNVLKSTQNADWTIGAVLEQNAA